MIIVNFKNYIFGRDLLSKCKKIERANKKIVVAVPATEIREISKKTKLQVYAQSVDLEDSGKSTGKITVEAVKDAGASGVLVNHSEHRISFREIKGILELCDKHGLKVVVCVESIKEAKKIAKLGPSIEAIALEDPKLVGSGMSITKYQGKRIEKFTNKIISLGLDPLCGAGISSGNDVVSAYKLGCKGVILSSAVAKGKSDRLIKKLGELA